MDRLLEIVQRIVAGLANVREALPVIINAPRAHAKEAMLLAVIVGLAVVFVVSAGMVIVDAIAGWVRNRRAGLRVRRRRGPVVVLAPLAALAFLFVVASQLPLIPRVGTECDACHSMSAAVASWKSGPHPMVGCFACHANPGVLARTSASVQEIARWVAAPSGASPAPVTSRACLTCHERINRYVLEGAVRVQHSDFMPAGLECVECHDNMGHSATAGLESKLARKPMTTCLLCHDGEQARAECEVCHRGRPSDLAAEPAPGAALIRPECTGGCHAGADSKRCASCHGLEMPHPESFTRVHARTSAQDPTLCTRCHQSAAPALSCGCHPDGQVHGSYSAWYPQHGTRARESGPGGCLCHDDTSFRMCLKCHESSPW